MNDKSTRRPLPQPPLRNSNSPKFDTYSPGSTIKPERNNAHQAFNYNNIRNNIDTIDRVGNTDQSREGFIQQGPSRNYFTEQPGSTFFVKNDSLRGYNNDRGRAKVRGPLPQIPSQQRPQTDNTKIKASTPSPEFQQQQPQAFTSNPFTRLPLANSSIMIHSGFWNILSATGSRFLGAAPAFTSPLGGEGGYDDIRGVRTSMGPENPLNTVGEGPRRGATTPTVSGGDISRKKRISVDQISKPTDFTHLLHASDAEQAQDLLLRWQKDGVGKLPTQSWIQPIKEAARARARALAVAEVQANREVGSLKIVNGMPSVLSTITVSSTGATDDNHSAELGMVREEDYHEELKPPTFPGLGVRTNTAQTILVIPEEIGTVRTPHIKERPKIDGLPSPPIDDSIFASFDAGSSETISEEDEEFGLPKNFVPSLTTIEKAVAAKIFFETHYYAILKKPRDRDRRKALLEAELFRLNISDEERRNVRAAFVLSESEYLRDMRTRVGIGSFKSLKVIGHGAFGVVSLAREIGSGELFAIKQIRKVEMLRKSQEGHVRAERDLLAAASSTTRWTVRLAYSFQDQEHLYLVMSFMSGGDLLTLLIAKDTFPEDFARFYLAEMVLAIQETHEVLGAIHRDIKPDNFLFDKSGHIKIADFGLATDFHFAHDGQYYEEQRRNLLKKHGIDLEDSRAPTTNRFDQDKKEKEEGAGSILTYRDKNRRKLAYSVVGTNNYMAVEVIKGHGYDCSADWWSLGVISFEMLYGYPPFVSKSRNITRQKIANWRTSLRFPTKPYVSREAQDFIASLICSKEDRLGSKSASSKSRPNSVIQQQRRSKISNPTTGTFGVEKGGMQDGAAEIRAHPFFRSVDFTTIHLKTPPFVPELTSETDSRYFEDNIEATVLAPADLPVGVDPKATRDPMLNDKAQGEHLLEVRKSLAFTGWTYKRAKNQVYDPQVGLLPSKKAVTRGRSTLRVDAGSGFRSLSV